MLYSGPDHAAQTYLRLRAMVESPSGFDCLDRAEVCRSCLGGPALTRGGGIKRDREGNLRYDRYGNARREERRIECASCNEPWDPVEVTELKAMGSRSCDPEAGWWLDAIDRLRHLRRVFEPRPLRMTDADWLFHRLAYFGYLDERFGTYEIVALEGDSLRLVDAPRPWTPGAVRFAVARMRQLGDERLAQQGLLARVEGGVGATALPA